MISTVPHARKADCRKNQRENGKRRHQRQHCDKTGCLQKTKAMTKGSGSEQHSRKAGGSVGPASAARGLLFDMGSHSTTPRPAFERIKQLGGSCGLHSGMHVCLELRFLLCGSRRHEILSTWSVRPLVCRQSVFAELLPQLCFLDFSCRCMRDFVHECDVVRHPPLGDLPLQEAQYV